MRTYNRDDIPALQAELDQWQAALAEYHKANEHRQEYSTASFASTINRISLALKFLDYWLDVEDRPDGLLVEGKYIVAIHKKRWRVDGRGQWYWYKDIDDLVRRYIKREVEA